MAVNIKITAGEYVFSTTAPHPGVFQAGRNSNVEFTGVTVNTTSGPIFEVHSPATFTGCTFTSDYPIDVYNTGGEVTVDGGNYTGTKAVIKIDGLSDNANPSVVNVAAGTFKGDVQAVENSQ